ncbi:MAG: helix-turn-helix transcriptional regulator [Actinomycetota bacterium]
MAAADVMDEGMGYFSVSIDTWGLEGIEFDADDAAEVGSMLNELGALGAATSIGGLAGGLGVTFGLSEFDDISNAEVYARVSHRAVDLLQTALDKAGVPTIGIANIEIVDERYADLQLEQEPERYVGTAEVAEYLGVSKQRVSELRSAGRMPAPVAELRAGPVWTVSSLRRFVDNWDRRPGRPRTTDTETQLLDDESHPVYEG